MARRGKDLDLQAAKVEHVAVTQQVVEGRGAPARQIEIIDPSDRLLDLADPRTDADPSTDPVLEASRTGQMIVMNMGFQDLGDGETLIAKEASDLLDRCIARVTGSGI